MPDTPARSVDFCLPVLFEESLVVQKSVGDKVKVGEVLALGSGRMEWEVNVAEALGVPVDSNVGGFLVKQLGETVEKGEVLAKKGRLMGKTVLKARESGVLESLEEGVLKIVKTEEEKAEVLAPVGGVISSVDVGRVEITLSSFRLLGVYSWGEMRWGEILCIPMHKNEVRLELVDEEVKGKVVVIGGKLSQALWFKLATLGAAGVVCGGVVSTFESWGMRVESFPALVVLGEDPDLIPADVLKWLEKQNGKLAFLLCETGEIVIEK